MRGTAQRVAQQVSGRVGVDQRPAGIHTAIHTEHYKNKCESVWLTTGTSVDYNRMMINRQKSGSAKPLSVVVFKVGLGGRELAHVHVHKTRDLI